MIRFFEAYAAYNVTFWGVTTQNEPSSGFLPNYKWQTMGFTAKTMMEFVKNDLGPALYASNLDYLKVMVLDDNRLLLDSWADRVRRVRKHVTMLCVDPC